MSCSRKLFQIYNSFYFVFTIN